MVMKDFEDLKYSFREQRKDSKWEGKLGIKNCTGLLKWFRISLKIMKN